MLAQLSASTQTYVSTRFSGTIKLLEIISDIALLRDTTTH